MATSVFPAIGAPHDGVFERRTWVYRNRILREQGGGGTIGEIAIRGLSRERL
jgi:hypothetical protein